jgi:hypothetical protein
MRGSTCEPSGPLTEETPRREAMRAMGAAGAALLGALGMNAASSESAVQAKSKRVGSEKKGKKGKKGKRGPAGPAGPAGPEGPPGQSAGAIYWASVDSQGTFIAGNGFVRSRNIGGKTGQYSVSVDGEEEMFESCAIVGMAADGNRISLGSVGFGSVNLRTERFDDVEHMFLDVDSAFSLIAICPKT